MSYTNFTNTDASYNIEQFPKTVKYICHKENTAKVLNIDVRILDL